eukprot:2986630-Pyramimonas_sp.AAC.1
MPDSSWSLITRTCLATWSFMASMKPIDARFLAGDAASWHMKPISVMKGCMPFGLRTARTAAD